MCAPSALTMAGCLVGQHFTQLQYMCHTTLSSIFPRHSDCLFALEAHTAAGLSLPPLLLDCITLSA
eukprot:COSAG02_NODE_1068_length_14812_cov_15.091342_12_plen_66_part_00